MFNVTVRGWLMNRAPGISTAISWLRPSDGPDRSFQSAAIVLHASCALESAADGSAVATDHRYRSADPLFQSEYQCRVVPWAPFCHPVVGPTIEPPDRPVKP